MHVVKQQDMYRDSLIRLHHHKFDFWPARCCMKSLASLSHPVGSVEQAV